jgi:hypothetical protein
MLSVDQSSITADTAALIQAQHNEMQEKLTAQANHFNEYIQSIQQGNTTNTTLPSTDNPMSGTAHNHGGGPAI